MMKQFLLALFIPVFIQAQTGQKAGSGNALSLNGANQNVDIGTFFNYQVFTIEMWLNPGSTQVKYADILDNNHTDFRAFVLQQNVSNTNQYVFFGASGSAGPFPPFNLKANLWQHIALVSTKTQKFVYVNGILVSSSGISADTIHYDGTQFLRLGRWGGGGRYWNGTMDEIRIWNAALTQDQIRNRMCRKIKTSDPLYSNLILYYNFDENTGSTVLDASANGHHGTLINNPARVVSGAPVGNASAYNYGGSSVRLQSSDSGNIRVDKIIGNPTGIHLYRVDTAPSIRREFKGLVPNKTYFGIFPFGDSLIRYRVNYTYTGDSYVIGANEISLKLYSRTSNSDTTWINTFAKLDTAKNSLVTSGNGSDEYILDSSGVSLQVPKFVIIADTAGNEGNTGTRTLKIPIHLNGAAVFNSSVKYTTADSTAKAGEDYVQKSGTINFAVGQLTDTIKITIKGDTKSESDEVFKVLLSEPVNVSIADTLALVTIQNDDAAGSGNALSLNGANQNVDIGTFFNYQVFTIEMWVNPGSTQVQYADILDNNHTDFRAFVLQQNVSNTNQYAFGASGSVGPFPAFNLKANVWQHIALVSTKTQKFVYVNGILVSSSGISADTIHYDGTQFIRLGRWGGGGRYWNGTMDEVRIWNAALTQDQIRNRMCRKIKISDPLYSSLILYYNFDENTGSTVFDASANGHNGTLINSPARILSGAPVGNTSAYTYGNSVKLNISDSEYIKVDKVVGSHAGIHLYRVNTAPSKKSGIKGLGSNKNYFGIFPYGDSLIKYRVTYKYTGNPYVIRANEDSLKLYSRTSNADVTWSNKYATLDTIKNTLVTSGDSTEEYILGSSGVTLQLPKSVSITDTTVNESNTGTKTLKIPVRLNDRAVLISSVNYTTADSTAKAGEDYIKKSGTIHFAIGQLTDTIRIFLKGDTTTEADEIFKILLSDSVNISIADTIVLVTIKNDDSAVATIELVKRNDYILKSNLHFNVSPNPTKSFINIISFKNITGAQVRVADMSGKTLYATKQNFVAGQQLKVSISQFPTGILIVTITSNNYNKQFKIIKE